MTPIELRNKSYQVLVDNLGEIDAIRFLQQMGWGRGDYTKEKQEGFTIMTREELWQDVKLTSCTFDKSSSFREGTGNRERATGFILTVTA